MRKSVAQSLSQLEQYCRKEGFKGWDPYDGLTSRVFRSIPFVNTNSFARLAWIQLFKRSPVNFRSIAGVKKDFNPKGLGLFLAGYCNLQMLNPADDKMNTIDYLTETIIGLKSENYSGACWGYNFDWQARAFFQPRYTPTVVATTFIANALLDAYEITKNSSLLKVARSACDFVLQDLNRTYDDEGNFSFSYSPLDKSVVFNASLLGSRLLSRVYSFTKEDELIKEAKKSVAYCSRKQNSDGSWCYGMLPFHRWIDSFHTGYNLECIYEYARSSGDDSYNNNIKNGLDYYINNFFTEEGIPKYYNIKTFPIDAHAPAQLVITIAKLNQFKQFKPLVDKVLQWTIANMQSEKGYFYFQLNKFFSSKIPYIRWSQAWMFYALSTYLLEESRLNSTNRP